MLKPAAFHFPGWRRTLEHPQIRRLMWVVVITFFLNLTFWLRSTDALKSKGLDGVMVYGMAISLSIWFLTDVARQWIFSHHREGQLWKIDWKLIVYDIVGVVLGFGFGMRVGDYYTGGTVSLLDIAPNQLMSIVLVTIGASLFFILFFFQQNRLSVARQQAVETKLTLLQAQLEPHMLFNTLANLRALIAVSPTQATQMLDRLHDYLRAVLSASRVQAHTLAAEFDRLQDYLHLMQVRLGGRLRYSLDLPDALRVASVPCFLLQPLVENAIKHGIEPSSSGGDLSVSASLVQNQMQLRLTVSDTGLGVSSMEELLSTARSRGMSFGLHYVKERLEVTYGRHATLRFEHKIPHGLMVIIELPMSTAVYPERARQ